MISKFQTRLGVHGGIVALAIAVVLVPAIARAHQRVEHRDATRLSIRHSWLAVAPPTKAVVAPQQVVVVPAVAIEPEPRRLSQRETIAPSPSPFSVPGFSPDPLRGPPSFSLA